MSFVVEKLTELYYTKEMWHKNIMPPSEALRYHKYMYEQGNIKVVFEKDEIVGYVEYWQTDFNGFMNIINDNVTFGPMHENIKQGEFCYIANCWVKDGSGALPKLYNIIRNIDGVKYVYGHEFRRSGRLRVYHTKRG